MSSSFVARRFSMVVMLLLTMLSSSIGVIAQESTPVAGSPLGELACPDELLAVPGMEAPSDLTEGEDFTCATLAVPQNHDAPDDTQLELFVITLPSRSDNPAPEPIIFLAGGPGGSGNAQLLQFSSEVPEPFVSFASLLDSHHVVLVDQRGTGFSQPSLACPADIALAATPGATPVSQPAEVPTEIDALELYGDCDEALADAGVDLTFFTTRQNAADIDALREALGAERANLVGTSYGTWLAQAVMRDYPDTVRSVVLNSPVPAQSDLFAGQLIGFQTALDASQDGCQADPACALAYPDLEDQLAQVVTTLNATPLTVTVEDPMSRQTADIPVDGTLFLGAVYQMHFIGPFVPLVAPLIASVAEGQTEGLAQLLPILLAPPEIARGFYYSVLCQDEVPFTSEEEVLAQAEAAGVSPFVIDNGAVSTSIDAFGVCADWGLPTSPPIANEPVVSNLPTLIVTGVFDPITPTAYGEELLTTLSNATLIESGIAGHDPLSTSGPCGVEVMISFIADPVAELDATCLTNARADFSPEQPAGGTPVATPAS